MKKRIAGLLLAALVLFSIPARADDETNEQTTTVPVTLTVVRTVRSIDVTLPAGLPVSVLDGKVMTATNLSIMNHSSSMSVVVSGVSVEDGGYRVVSFGAFPRDETNVIALRINGCETEGSGPLPLTADAFPVIAPNASLPIQYSAKVLSSGDVSDMAVAQVVFTLRAEYVG